MVNLETWFEEEGRDKLFRMYRYRRMFTPYEQQNAFMDESMFEDNHATMFMIRQLIELPDKDVLIEYQQIFTEEDFYDDNPPLYYVKLSEIRLEYFPNDLVRVKEESSGLWDNNDEEWNDNGEDI